MKVIAVFAALFVASVMGSGGLVENHLVHSEKFGHALFRAGFDAPLIHKELHHPIAYDAHVYDGHYPRFYNGEFPHFYDGTYHHDLHLDTYNLRHLPYDYRYKNGEAVTTDFRYNLPYGYSHRDYLY
ncbi:uncharacterized protein LOC129799370 [Phlebotomus papatasi]|uniref:Uncharacterized protein n=1 Tax=Phlebotomus papatasi TaxID=29031 RepID=A0A1B0D6M1_PHLPP|nr:uncharacterized protein LOC129799370 [Phlebotomus papatasi]